MSDANHNDDPLPGVPVPVPMPPDVIRIAPEHFSVMLAPTDDGLIDLGLMFTAPAPLGTVRYSLTAGQIRNLYDTLHSLVHLSDHETAAVLNQIHGTTEQEN